MRFQEAHWLWFERAFAHRAKQEAETAILRLLTELRTAGRFAPVPNRWDDFYRRISAGF